MSTAANTPRVGAAGDGRGAGLRVPWSTVLPLAVVAAFGNGFWLIVVRDAVGAIERTQRPFTAWLQESTLLLPLYVFAVLLALTLARRWFGPGPLRARSVVATLLMAVLASTLVGTGVQAVSAVYDYRLQAAQVTMMASRMPTCDAVCVGDEQRSALLLQARALGLNGLVMLASNLVLLGLVVAFRGGRVDLASPRAGSTHRPSFVRPAPMHTRPIARARDDDRRRVPCGDLERVLVVALLAAAAIHASVVRGHLAEWPAAGVFFILLTVAQTSAAALVLARLRPAALPATVAVSAGPILLWLCSRTAGLPFGPTAGVPEPVGLADAAAGLLEVTALALAFALLRPRRPWRAGTAPPLTTLALAGVVALAVVGVAAGLGLFGAEAGLHMGSPVHHQTASSAPA